MLRLRARAPAVPAPDRGQYEWPCRALRKQNQLKLDQKRGLPANGQMTAYRFRIVAGSCRRVGRLGVGNVLAHVFAPLPLKDAGRLAAASAQVIELGSSHLAPANDFDRVDERAVDRKHPLDALAVGDLAYGEALIQAGTRASDADPLEGLEPLAGLVLLGFLVVGDIDHLDVDFERIARPELGELPPASGRVHLFPLEGLDQVHFVPPSGGSLGEERRLLADKARFS